MSDINMDEIIRNAVALAEAWQRRANELLTSEEKAIQEQMHSLLTNPVDKTVLTKMIDQSFRSHNPSRVADQVNYLLREFGVPDFFSRTERLLIQMFMGVGRHFAALTVPSLCLGCGKAAAGLLFPVSRTNCGVICANGTARACA